MRTYIRLPSRLPKIDPDWMLKRFRGEKLDAPEVEEYMKWKHEKKIKSFKKIIKGVHQGTLLKVHGMNAKKRVYCEVGAGCTAWNKEVYDGFFGRCGLIDPFEDWYKNVKMKEFEESLSAFGEIFHYETFENPKTEKAQFDMDCYW